MKREIKFRVWDKVKHIMIGIEQLAFDIDGELVSIYSNGPDFSNDVEALMGEKPNLNDAVLMEYTGLKDKNGKDIYEGDIVRCEHDYQGTDYTGKVMFFNGGFCVWTGGFRNYVWDDMVPEIIGNIHENPELLEVDE